ncbi:HNH endonuclease [Streptomyces phage JimJam]|nr:HNH endonuclease [Streptomyces phage JimJam]
MKTCTICGKEKDSDSFAFRNKAKGIRRAQCKSCMSDYDKSKYQTPERKQAIKENDARRRQELIDRVWAIKNKASCADCGYSNPIALEFDHLPQFQKSYNVSEMVDRRFAWSKIEEEIAKCEIVCANCHKIRTHTRDPRRVRNITVAC